jgi:hypothetical protein
MDFLESIILYYNSEYKAGYFIGAVIGGLLLLAVILLWKFASPFSLLKGLTIPLLIAGIFMGIGGSLSGHFTQKAYLEKMKLYQQNRREFFKQEVAKVQRIHKSWFGIRVWWTIVAIAGLTVAIAAKKNYTIGVGIGVLIFGLLGHVEEAISYHRNETYKNFVLKAAEKDVSLSHKPFSSHGKASLHPSLSRIDSIAPLPKRVCDTQDTLMVRQTADTLRLVYLNTSSLPKYELAQLNDNPVLKSDTLSNLAELSITTTHKHHRIVDYYNSDLIAHDRVSSKSCWFGKKYMRE